MPTSSSPSTLWNASSYLHTPQVSVHFSHKKQGIAANVGITEQHEPWKAVRQIVSWVVSQVKLYAACNMMP